VNKELGNILKL